jgi:hypothetical protein
MIPEYWKIFIESNELIGKNFELSEGDDLSEIGADFQIMNEKQCISEATEAYPGIVAIKQGYFPVAMCLEGSGDYYYIKTNEGNSGALYRIYHDSVDGKLLRSDGIEKVLNNYASLL